VIKKYSSKNISRTALQRTKVYVKEDSSTICKETLQAQQEGPGFIYNLGYRIFKGIHIGWFTQLPLFLKREFLF